MANHSQNLQVRVLEPSLSHPFVPSMSFWFHPAVFVRAVPSSISPQKRYAVFPRHRNGWGALLPVLLSNDGSLLCVEGGMIQINSSLIPCGYLLLPPPLCHLLGAHHFTDSGETHAAPRDAGHHFGSTRSEVVGHKRLPSSYVKIAVENCHF